MKQNSSSEENVIQELLHNEKPHRLGWFTILLIFGIFGSWAIFVDIETTVPANGIVISKGYKKIVQHPRGGLVTKLYVKEGDHVKTGDPLLKLDSVTAQTQLTGSMAQADELKMQKARLEAEAYNRKPDFKSVFSTLFQPQNAPKLLQKEQAIYQSDIHQRNLKIQQLQDKNKILYLQNEALQLKIASNQKLLNSYQKELKKWKQLFDQNMTDELKLLDRERRIEDIRSEITQAQSQIKENKATVIANKNQIALVQNQFVNEARHKLKDITIHLSEIKEKIAALQNEVKNSTVRAPDEGIVTDMKIHSIGEVVTPHKPIAAIVPNKGSILLEAYVEPTDIDKIHSGQLADIHFPSYVDPSSVPVEGKIIYISADTIIPEGQKTPFYKILIEITPKGEKAIQTNGFKIVPGMPISAAIKAGKRSFMSYILLPIEQLFRGAFHAN